MHKLVWGDGTRPDIVPYATDASTGILLATDHGVVVRTLKPFMSSVWTGTGALGGIVCDTDAVALMGLFTRDFDEPRPRDTGVVSVATLKLCLTLFDTRDFLAGAGSSRQFNEFKFPCDGLLLFSDRDRLDVVGGDGAGGFTGTRRRRPMTLVILPGFVMTADQVLRDTLMLW